MITNNDHARKLIEAHGIAADNVTRPQLKLLHSLIDGEMKSSGLYDGKYGMNPGVSKFMTCHSNHWEKREAVSFNRDGFIGFAGWAGSQNTRPILDAVEKWLEEIRAGKAMTDEENEILDALKAEEDLRKQAKHKTSLSVPTWHIRLRLDNKFNSAKIRRILNRLEQQDWVSSDTDFAGNRVWSRSEEECLG